MKIGCVFTQLGINENDLPEREPASTSYTAAIEGAQDFGRRLYAEAGCKNVIAHRFKTSGMFWSVEGANDILQLRTTELSGYWKDFLETRLPS